MLIWFVASCDSLHCIIHLASCLSIWARAPFFLSSCALWHWVPPLKLLLLLLFFLNINVMCSHFIVTIINAASYIFCVFFFSFSKYNMYFSGAILFHAGFLCPRSRRCHRNRLPFDSSASSISVYLLEQFLSFFRLLLLLSLAIRFFDACYLFFFIVSCLWWMNQTKQMYTHNVYRISHQIHFRRNFVSNSLLLLLLAVVLLLSSLLLLL